MTYEQKIDRLASTTTSVPIHDLYANSLFRFTYPLSETQSYYLLQDCLVALFYQLYLICRQCNSTQTFGNGWGYCKYGEGVDCDGKDGKGCTSWICPVGNKSEHEKNKKCGTDKASPLQAFLTDCLKGFTCPVVMDKMEKHKDKINTPGVYLSCYMEFLEHRTHLPVGQYCPIPMGFSGSFRSRGANGTGVGMSGLALNAICAHYANDDLTDSCLYQVTRCISSLTRRVPRSTGTLYGFFYGVGQVAFHRNIWKDGRSQNDDTFKKALEGELKCCPGWRKPSDLMKALMGWTESDHSKNHTDGKPAKPTLGSLCMCNYKKQNGSPDPTCGDYLKPLTGSMYKCVSDRFCETYVSWIVHLSWRLQSGLQKLLEEFVKIDCSKSGCSTTGGSSSHCCQGGDNHGTACRCDNVVKCVGVHGLFYRFGFSYRDPDNLTGSSKKQCKDFVDRLGKVLTEKYFQDLSKQLRKFMYSTRALFGVYIGVYWSAVLVYLLWSMTYNLDLIHIQSHWRSPGSYLVPLQRILADGSRKGFCTLGYFRDAPGDRLLSQGVSDVYL
ncbi:variant erythrocyte surface antigen beta subunit, putative [Babesia ovis]|uniref:Variant erythrocyte surface antigen beta subunit, putative n=1 Tax=Babesia ovis TaxID=5869 RepID=A0A9W5WWJ5_BABOV|nr:variant erythrocyte surface antigen beta subunit, putative [Babesia ovis]